MHKGLDPIITYNPLCAPVHSAPFGKIYQMKKYELAQLHSLHDSVLIMSSRGRSRTRSSTNSRGGKFRRVVSLSDSRSASRQSRNNLMRTWPLKQAWNQMPDPFPFKTVATLRYSSLINLDASTSGTQSHVFRANSIFDPDQSGVGHQPYGHDQYASIYQFYRVKKCIITVSNASQGANNTMGVTLRATPTLVAGFEHIKEVKGTRYTCLANFPDPYKVSLTYDLQSPDQSQDTALFGENPSLGNFFHVWVAGNGSADPTGLAIAVDLTYIVEMWEPLYLGSS